MILYVYNYRGVYEFFLIDYGILVYKNDVLIFKF